MNCENGFGTSGPCGVSFIGQGGQPWAVVGTQANATPTMKGSAVNLIPKGGEHVALSLNYQTQLDIRQFTITFSFVPNGKNVCLAIQNSTNNPWGFNGAKFSAGAGCEAGFFQGYSQPEPPDHVFALELDSFSALSHSDAWNFTYSSTQIYKTPECPCLPDDFHGKFPIKDKISTSPCALNSPANGKGTTTGHNYTAIVTYDGQNFSLDLQDTTVNGPHFKHTWTDVDIPEIVGASEAYVGFTAATGSGPEWIPNSDLLINSFSYVTETKPPDGGGPPPDGGTEPEPVPFTGTLTIKGVTYNLTGTATPPPAKSKKK